MTDHELLELAAKAAGVRWVIMNGWCGDIVQRKNIEDGSGVFDPLTDDGDALRLAVRLHICTLYPMRGTKHKECGAGQVGGFTAASMELHDPDPYAATRRAITRAAAEIGRSMK